MLEVITFSAITFAALLILPRLFSASKREPHYVRESPANLSEQIRSRVVVSYSVYIVFAALSLVFIFIPTVLFIPSLIKEGRALNVIISLAVLVVNFLLGYIYFIRPLRVSNK